MPELSSQQKRSLRKLQGRLPHPTGNLAKAEMFLLEYIAFESQSRKLWHYYRCRNAAKKESKAGIPLDEMKNALIYFGADTKINFLSLLLDSSLTRRDKKSARNLRNGIVHHWSEKDCKEAEDRYAEFHSLFMEFRTLIRRIL